MRPDEVLKQTCCYGESEIEIPKEAKAAFFLGMGNYIESGLHGLWLEPEDAHDGHRPDRLAVTIGQRFSALESLYNGAQTQSPIEDMLAGALLWLDVDWGGMPIADPACGPDDWRTQFWQSQRLEFVLTPQAPVAGHKVDFLLWFARGRHIQVIAVECDGHAFHEKTKEQAARDKKRDREILGAGFPVMRFSGSEIYRDVLGCAEQIREALTDPLDRVSRDSGLF